MISQTLPFFALIATSLALSIPLAPSSLIQLPSQNDTLSSPPTNATTNTHLGAWPDAPFSRHLAWDTDLEIISRTPAPASDPTSEMGVLEGISFLGAKARAQSRLASIEDFDEESGPVMFRFHATEELFSGQEIAMVLDALWEMTNRYGKGGVYGCLIRVGFHTGFFELALKRVVEGAKK
ncbi:MAG: hypothetical protein ASARMPREDX12_002526 [Alectoria sarmentosa]|nr:MAG: hypothetical protein ASARMPREDX12_002526 [Alectoria sarmentosa]